MMTEFSSGLNYSFNACLVCQVFVRTDCALEVTLPQHDKQPSEPVHILFTPSQKTKFSIYLSLSHNLYGHQTTRLHQMNGQ